MSYNHLTDDMLVRLLKASDEHAFKAIFKKYWRKMYETACRKLHSKELAEEMTQQVFLSVWEKRAQSDIMHLEAYLSTAIKYRCISHYESKYSKVTELEGVLENRESAYHAEDIVEYKELSALVNKALEMLPNKTRTVFELSRYGNFTAREIAQKLNLSEKSVEYHVTQSLKLIRQELKSYYAGTIVLFLLCLLKLLW